MQKPEGKVSHILYFLRDDECVSAGVWQSTSGVRLLPYQNKPGR